MITYLVDLDGTIIDPKAGMIGSLRAALRETGHPELADRDYDWIIGPPLIESIERLLGRGDVANRTLETYREHYVARRGMFEFTVYDGMIEAVDALRVTGRLCICTMKPIEFARRILAKLELEVPIFGADLAGLIRSKDQIICGAMEDWSIDPRQAVVIGDRGSDMKAARTTGLRGIGVTWGYGSREELIDAGAAELCEAPRMLATMAHALAKT